MPVVREWVVDLLLALALAGLAVGSVFVKDPTEVADYPAPNAALVLLSLSASLPLALRRRWPAGVFIVGLGSWCVIEIMNWNAGVVPACVLFALYAAGSWQPLVPSVACVLALYVAVLGQTFLSGESLADPLMYMTLAGFTVVWLGGVSVQALRQRQRHAVARALEAERTRTVMAERAVFAERLRIARELHDVVAHTLSVIVVQSAVARQLVGASASAEPALRAIEDASREAIDDLHRMLGLLRTEPLDAPAALSPSPGLDDLDALAAAHRAAHGPVEVIVGPGIALLPESVRLTAFRLVQEALTNVRKHAPGAGTVVRVVTDGHRLEIEVDNDPVAEPPVSATPGFGLTGMRERVSMFDGSLESGTRADGGFHIRAVLHAAPDQAVVT